MLRVVVGTVLRLFGVVPVLSLELVSVRPWVYYRGLGSDER